MSRELANGGGTREIRYPENPESDSDYLAMKETCRWTMEKYRYDLDKRSFQGLNKLQVIAVICPFPA
jgi:hypothetical protein